MSSYLTVLPGTDCRASSMLIPQVQDVTLTDEQLGELLKKSTFQNLSSKFPED